MATAPSVTTAAITSSAPKPARPSTRAASSGSTPRYTISVGKKCSAVKDTSQ